MPDYLTSLKLMSESINNITRREAVGLISASTLTPHLFGAQREGADRVPWYAAMRRCGQTNFNERDPIELDIGWWVKYWSSLKLDALLLNAGGIMAFYPTKIPYHHRSQFLTGMTFLAISPKPPKLQTLELLPGSIAITYMKRPTRHTRSGSTNQ